MDSTQFRFSHYKLIAWQLARQLADRVQPVVARLPRRYEAIGQQLLRAAVGTEALIAEGANRYSPKQKRQRFVEARGECGETASHLERLWRYGLIGEEEASEMLALADRVCALCTGLIRRHS
jgi:four helix bundle protein